MQKARLLTDSAPKRAQALQKIETSSLKASLIAGRKRKQLYSDGNKVEIVKTYIALGGNLALTAASTGAPLRTLENWKASEWWKRLFSEIKKCEKLELSAKTKIIVERSLDLIVERLENGDFFVNPKTGELERKPLPAKELSQIAKDMLDRKLILDKAFEVPILNESSGDKLASLAERFAKLAEMSIEGKKPSVVVTDVVFATEVKDNVDAQNEKREEGLQPAA